MSTTTAAITAVNAEESPLYPSRLLVTTVYADGTVTEKHLSGAVARRYIRTQRAKIAA